MSAADDWLRFAFLGLHPERSATLLERHGGVAAALAALAALSARPEDEPVPLRLEDCRGAVESWGGSFDVAADTDWSRRFVHVADAPNWMFREGAIGEEPMVAIVGTRRCTEYGRRIALEFGAACAGAGWTVVSGLARGIDTAAHRGAVEAGGRTVAVLGSGPDIDYPRQNKELKRRILSEEGAILTEYPPGAEPLPWRFPPRNRIISGLSVAVVVVESRVTGGSLSTAARAVTQGRTVLAVPGDIDRVASVGCNLLIRDGAIPVLGPDDLIEALSLLAAPGVVDRQRS